MPGKSNERTPEEFLRDELANIVGADLSKMASSAGLKDLPEPTFPGMPKIASLREIDLRQLMEDPNFKDGMNAELDKLAKEWVPIAKAILKV